MIWFIMLPGQTKYHIMKIDDYQKIEKNKKKVTSIRTRIEMFDVDLIV